MKRRAWVRLHKWIGLPAVLFLILFCLSGIVLNHREAVTDWEVNRNLLPKSYAFDHWNKGLMRGTLRLTDTAHSEMPVMIYGVGGAWLTDTVGSQVLDFNLGLPKGAENRKLRSAATNTRNQMFAVNYKHVYARHGHLPWEELPLSEAYNEHFSDLTTKGDTLVVVGHSHLYLATPPYDAFRKITLRGTYDTDTRPTLSRAMNLFHSGQLFGLGGRLFVDAIALVFTFLLLSSILASAIHRGRIRRKLHRWHNFFGRKTIVLTFLLCLTGLALHPSLMKLVGHWRIPAIPHTRLSNENAWNNCLRMLRWDNKKGDWLLSTSEGFFCLPAHALDEDATPADLIPQALPFAPSTHKMELSVWECLPDGSWAMGTSQGLFTWNRKANLRADFITGATTQITNDPVLSNYLNVSGFSKDLNNTLTTVDYHTGTCAIPQPEQLATLPMSFGQLSLDIHNGRILTFLETAHIIYIFIAGLIICLTLWSGWILRGNARKKIKL